MAASPFAVIIRLGEFIPPTSPSLDPTSNHNNMPKQTRPLYEVAREIRRVWTKPYFGAVPYLDAMASLDKITDNYFADSADSIVRYFLSNASTWKGKPGDEESKATIKRIKDELKAML